MEIEIPIDLIHESFKALPKDLDFDNNVDFEALKSVRLITDYINDQIQLNLKCGSFRILKRESKYNFFSNLDSEVPNWETTKEEILNNRSLFIFFNYKEEIFYIEPYCLASSYIINDDSVTVLDLNGVEMYTYYSEFIRDEGCYTIRCLNNLQNEFDRIYDDYEYNQLQKKWSYLVQAFRDKLENLFDFPEGLYINVMQHTPDGINNVEYLDIGIGSAIINVEEIKSFCESIEVDISLPIYFTAQDGTYEILNSTK